MLTLTALPYLVLALALSVGGYLLYLLFVDRFLKAAVPGLVRRVPGPVWMLFISIAVGKSIALLSPASVGLLRSWTGAIRDGGVSVLVVMVVAQVYAAEAVDLTALVKRLMRPAALGVLGTGLGGLVSVLVLWLAGRSGSELIPDDVWDVVWRGVIANVNGWTGDSSTLMPVLALVTDDASKVQPAPLVFLLDSICGVAWFTLAMAVAKKTGKGSVGPAPKTAASVAGRFSAAGVAILLAALVGGAALMVFTATDERLKTDFFRPFIVMIWFCFLALIGYACAARKVGVGDKKVRDKLLGLVLCAFGVSAGLQLAVQVAAEYLVAFGLLAGCALLQFGLHFCSLLFFRRHYGWCELFTASMCSIGGFATAPQVAKECAAELIGPCYVVCLVCNLLSLVVFFVLWYAFLPLR